MADDVIGKLVFKVETDTKDAKKNVEDFNSSMEETQKIAQETDEKMGESSSGISAKWLAVAAAVGAAVIKLGKDIAKATDEIQSGQQTIVNATGATGEALEGLVESAKTVFANNVDSFEDVSRAIGEINTRLGMTGTELEETTDMFLDFARATGQDVQQSVVSVTQAMNRWGLEAEDIPSLLDKLVYAGQASGISVSTLEQALIDGAGTLQTFGYSLDDSIALMMQLETQGIDSSQVIMAMKKSFQDSATAGTDARKDWEDLMESISNATDEAEANSIALSVFGSRIATDMVKALQDGSLNFDHFSESLQNTEGNLKSTDEAGKTTAERIETLKHSVTLALADIGTALAPVIEDLLPVVSELLTEVFGALEPIIPVIVEMAKQVIPPLVNVIKQVISAVKPIVEAILPTVTSLLGLVGTAISEVFKVLSPILDVLISVVQTGLSLVNSILKPILDLLDPLLQVLGNIATAFLEPLIKTIETVLGWIEKLVEGIKSVFDWLSSLFGASDDAKANWDALSDEEKARRQAENAPDGWKYDYGYEVWDYDEGHPLLSGSRYIPYDGYRAKLHKGETVLDPMDSDRFRALGGLYGLEQLASLPLGMDSGLSAVSIDNNLSAVIEVDGTQLGIAVLKNIDNASQFILR